MNQLRFNKILELQEKVTKYFFGGYSGLESIFNYYLNLDDFVYNHRNFEDFYNGKPVEILGYYNEKNFIKNSGKVDVIIFKDFFEANFIFEYSSTYFNVFCQARNIMQETINQIYQLSLDSDYTENEKSIIIQDIVLKISNTIENSDKCNKNDNEILYDKLIYISNGYKLTYIKIYEMFGQYINLKQNNFLNSNFTNDINSLYNQKKAKIQYWHLIFNDILNGNIVVTEVAKNKNVYYYKDNEFKNMSSLGNHLAKIYGHNKTTIRLYFTQSTWEIDSGDKNIFVYSKKLEIKDLMLNKENKMCAYFQNKLNKLFSLDQKSTF